MPESLITGFLLGSSLIIAIGAQNIYVLRQGLLRQHVFLVATFCSASDAILIFIGIGGISLFFDNFIYKFSDILFIISGLWLALYGLLRLNSAIKSSTGLDIKSNNKLGIIPTLSTLSVITFANPHVYLDTVVLIGSVSQQFSGQNKYFFGIGASLASVVFFFSIAYGAKLIIPIMQSSFSWRLLDIIVAIIMFIISINLIMQVTFLFSN